MQVGKWFTAHLGIAAVHEEGFHQADPDNYHELRLAHEELLSFHKFTKRPPPNDRTIDVDVTVARYGKELMKNPSLAFEWAAAAAAAAAGSVGGDPMYMVRAVK